MVLKIIAIFASLVMSFMGYVYMWDAKENRKINNHPILFFILEWVCLFLSVTWIIMFYILLGLL